MRLTALAWLLLFASACDLGSNSERTPPGDRDDPSVEDPGDDPAVDDPKVDPGDDDPLPSSAWEYVGPGGMGAFSAVREHPTNPDILVAGSDVGGPFTSWDGGQTWYPGRHIHDEADLAFNPLEVHDIDVALRADGTAVWYLATAEGVFRGDLEVPGVATWRATTPLPPVVGGASNGDVFRQSVQVVVVNPSDPQDVWVGMGRAWEPNIAGRLRHQPHKVYRSRDGGQSWDASLGIPEATVFSMRLDPLDAQRAWVGTNRGLFATRDGGATWLELGISNPRITANRGESWQSCLGNTACPVELRVSPCSGSSCLPIASSAGESRPNVRDVEVVHTPGGTLLYAAAWDRGHANQPASACLGAGFIFDPNLQHTRTGPWVSEDGGASWRWLLRDAAGNPLLDSLSVRCNASSPEYFTHTNLPFLRVNPDDPTHIIAGGHGVNRGIYVLRDGQWRWVSPTAEFEGGASQGISGPQLGPAVLDLRVDWANEHLLLTHTRGLLRAWELPSGTWYFKNLAHHPVEGPPHTWRSHGMDNACPLDLAFGEKDGEPVMYMAVADGGVFRSSDGLTWTDVARSWWGLGVAADDSYAVVTDPANGWVYAANSPSVSSAKHVLRSKDAGESWEVLGGTLPTGRVPLSLAIDHGSDLASRRVLMGSQGDGVWVWEGAWRRLWNCPGGSVRDILTDPAFPDVAYLALDASNASNHGIWALDLRNETCARLDTVTSGCTLCRPSSVTLAEQDGERWLLASTSGDFAQASPQLEPRVWARPLPDPAHPVAWVAWEPRLDPRQGVSDTHPLKAIYDQHAISRPLTTIRASPTDRSVVTVGAKGNPFFDGFSAPVAFLSTDGGATFHELEPPPTGANIHRFAFSNDGELYALTACSSMWRTREIKAAGR